jgi:hypothetical protein
VEVDITGVSRADRKDREALTITTIKRETMALTQWSPLPAKGDRGRRLSPLGFRRLSSVAVRVLMSTQEIP